VTFLAFLLVKASELALSFLTSFSAGLSLAGSLFTRNFCTEEPRLEGEARKRSGERKELE
jgi:hypothetical protein